MTSEVSVTPDIISGLGSPALVVDLLRCLLHAEAQTHKFARSGILVPSQINAPDGGEDGRIEWDGDPSSTAYLPGRICLFQCKTQKMSPADCSRDVIGSNGKIFTQMRMQAVAMVQLPL